MDNIPVMLMLSVQIQMEILPVFVMMVLLEMATAAWVLLKTKFTEHLKYSFSSNYHSITIINTYL